MCYVYGSVDQATAACRMCKAYKPSGRCPHVTEVCRNRANHPRGDVVYFKNAEAQSFNGCGFCRWARTNPPAKSSGYQNPGWPGCCRAPLPHEYKAIMAADWPAVSIIHGVPMPPEAKSALELASAKLNFTDLTASFRGHGRSPSQPSTFSRRTGAAARGDTTPVKSTSLPIPSRTRGSPPQSTSSLASNPLRNAGGECLSSSLPNTSLLDQVPIARHSIQTQLEKRRDTSRDTRNSPGRKPAELNGTMSRKGSVSRPAVSANYSPPYGGKLPLDQPQPRRALVANTNLPTPASSAQPRTTDRDRIERERNVKPNTLRRGRSPLDESFAAMSVNGDAYASSSDSGGSETTVISDGGFTDYLSDESEAELQRQAEVKAALITQSHVEEQEFRAARQQLANIGLQPPANLWAGGVNPPPRSRNVISAATGVEAR